MNSLRKPELSQDQSVDALLKTIKIPARPSLLAEVQTELAKVTLILRCWEEL